MIQVQVEKMNCGGCAKSVTKAIHRLDPDARVEIHLASGAVAITTGTDIVADRFADAIRVAGYAVAVRVHAT